MLLPILSWQPSLGLIPSSLVALFIMTESPEKSKRDLNHAIPHSPLRGAGAQKPPRACTPSPLGFARRIIGTWHESTNLGVIL